MIITNKNCTYYNTIYLIQIYYIVPTLITKIFIYIKFVNTDLTVLYDSVSTVK